MAVQPIESVEQGVVVVTGASAGLGRALSIEFARRGQTVAGFGRREAELQQTAILAGPRFSPVTVDVSDPGSVAAAFRSIETRLGPVTVLVNNAAVYPHRDFLKETPESFMATVAVNLGGVVNCSHAALQAMLRTGWGRIVNVGSFADLAPLPSSGAYSVSKGAARIFTRALVADLADRFPNIVISTWMPGILATEMGLADGLDPALAAGWGADLALWHDQSLNGVMFDRDQEVLEPRSLKRRLLGRLLMRKAPKPRRLGTDGSHEASKTTGMANANDAPERLVPESLVSQDETALQSS
jgi:NAD(P)-dependent dehydrogenase (short-subunit alcohol dehydrogenase family)